MSTTQETIRSWLQEAKTRGATHCLIVCDTYDHEDYPVEVMPGEDAKAKYDNICVQSMQRVMEVYNLSMDLESQLGEHRAFHL